MKKLAIFFALVFIWGCQDKALMSPSDNQDRTDDSNYGSSVITIPGIKGLGKTGAPAAGYKFSLTITGPNMDPMSFGFPVGSKDTAVIIDKIPAGSSRLFTGTLYSPQGPTHSGSAYTDIQPGVVSYVKLYLRSTGSAQVDIIIEGINDKAGQCYQVRGQLDTVLLDNFTMKIIQNSDTFLLGYFYQNEVMVGKLYGNFNTMISEGKIVIPGLIEEATFFGGFTPDHFSFKGNIFTKSDTGYLYGQSIPCETITPPDTVALGCMKLGGYIIDSLDTLPLDGYIASIIGYTGKEFWTYVYDRGKIVGKFWGTHDGSMTISGEFSLFAYTKMVALVKGTSGSPQLTDFKAELYSLYDSTRKIGIMYGAPTPCSDTLITAEK